MDIPDKKKIKNQGWKSKISLTAPLRGNMRSANDIRRLVIFTFTRYYSCTNLFPSLSL